MNKLIEVGAVVVLENGREFTVGSILVTRSGVYLYEDSFPVSALVNTSASEVVEVK